MIIVTGGAGFIGSNIVRGLNRSGNREIVVVDELSDGRKFRNLLDCEISDYLDKDEFRRSLSGNAAAWNIEAVIHHGACSDTMEWDGRMMMENNFTYSRDLLDYCLAGGIPFIYASSASVYGADRNFVEEGAAERPVNVYGFSKKLFDDYVRRKGLGRKSQVVGLRYFNVYGRNEAHKARMASVIFHFHNQLLQDGCCRLFRGSGGYGDGEQRRDFVYVDDVVDVNLWFLERPEICGIFNVGTGKSCSFNEIAEALIDILGHGRIEYIDFPQYLGESYQHFTEADMRRLRDAGYREKFRSIREGLDSYLAKA